MLELCDSLPVLQLHARPEQVACSQGSTGPKNQAGQPRQSIWI